MVFASESRSAKMKLLNGLVAVLFALLASSTAECVIPESGHYWVPSEPGRGYLIEHQNGKVGFLAFAYDSSGRPEWYIASGDLREDAAEIPGSDPPLNAGYYPLHWMRATLFRVEGGPCLGCDFDAIDRTQPIGSVEIYFPFTKLPVLFFTFPNASLPFDRVPFSVTRFGFGYGRFGSDDPTRLASGIPDMRGQWVFRSASPGSTLLSFRFGPGEYTRESLDGLDYRVTFRDSTVGAELRCKEGTVGIAAGATNSAPQDGCELFVANVLQFSMLDVDMGVERVLASRGPLTARVGGTFRHPERIVGIRFDN